MARVYLDTQAKAPVAPKQRVYLDTPRQPVAQKKRVYLDTPPKQPAQKSEGLWNKVVRNLAKPIASGTNLVEDTVKTGLYPILNQVRPTSFEDYKRKLGIDFTGHQADVWQGRNLRAPSDIAAEFAGTQFRGDSIPQKTAREMALLTGVGGDFILDPLNKVSVLGLTAKGNDALKTGKLALSAADQASQGQRALLQFGKTNILPSLGNRVLAGATKANDAIRGTKLGSLGADILSEFSTSVRPGGVTRGDFKTLRDATVSAKNIQNYTKDKAIQFAKNLEQSLRRSNADEGTRSAILHAIEKGDKSLAPKGLEKIFDEGVAFKASNEAQWKALGGDTLDNYGLAHVATDEVANQGKKKGFGGAFSPHTPQDIHREWVRINPGKESGEIKVGATVKASDRGNFGKVIAVDGDNVTVSFTNKETGLTATKDFKKDEILNNNPIYGGGIANLKDEGIQFGNVERKGYTPLDILESARKELGFNRKPTIPSVNNFTQEEILQSALKELSATPKQKIQPSEEFIQKLNRLQQEPQVFSSSKTYKKNPDIYKEAHKGDSPLHEEAKLDDLLSQKNIKGDFSFSKKTSPLKKSMVEGVYYKGKKIFDISQASAQEINNFMKSQGKNPIFKEDLPTVVAKMGISTGRKEAGVEFLEATKGLEGKAKELANEAYQKITDKKSLAEAVKVFDKIQNIWKAQVLVAPSYHIRNEVGNLWNNYLAGIGPDAYRKAGSIQQRILQGKLSKAESLLVEDMKKQGVINTGQYGGDITQAIADEIGGASVNPLSQRFGLYKGNRAVGSTIEDNAKIAHYLQKIGDGFAPKQAADSVKKYLFDYGDLTWTEQNVLKRVMPFYTWTRKNIPLQIQEFANNPGKFSNVATLQRNVEGNVEQPNEKYLNDYVKNNSPMRIRTNSDGTTSYLLLGSWLPSASAIQFLSQAPSQIAQSLSPVIGIPSDYYHNSSFFKDTLGNEQPIEKYPGELKSFLGVDMEGKTANVLRGIRVLSELDKWNPGLIFGGKNTPSIIPGGSQNRGAKQSPDAPELTRFKDFLTGKTQTYDPNSAKGFYDRDTQNRMDEYTQALDQAARFGNQKQVDKIILDMEKFQQERSGQPSKVLDQYNLMGQQYLDDRFKNKQAEFKRDDARTKMKDLISQAVKTGNTALLQEAAKLDPSYISQAIKDAVQENQKANLPDDMKRQLYQYEQFKTESKLNPFYTK